MTNCWAVIVAAGRGTRTGLAFNKAFYRVNGQTVLERCIARLEKTGCFDGAVLVLHPDDMHAYRTLEPIDFVRHIAFGGDTRQASVRNGLEALPEDAQIVSIHDAARMSVPETVVRDTVKAARLFGSGVAATRISDTVKRVNAAGDAVETLDRDILRAIQTPQTFAVKTIRAAHAQALREGYIATDDAALVERYIGPVHLCVSVEGATNRKITTREDVMALSERTTASVRVGMGIDAHRLVEGRDLVLLGVTIPHTKGLLGHSDADVAAHACMDALLGAAALGDIGQIFPDNDPAYAGIRSMLLVSRVAALLDEHGFVIVNVDVTIVAQAPKIAPWRDSMRAQLAKALAIPVERVSVKATTTEGMGYEGRAEGISAQCVACITKE